MITENLLILHVNSRMDILSEIQNRLRPELERMNGIIHEALSTRNALMDRVVRSYLIRKGKQIRPIMVLLSARLFGEANEHVIHASAALEMLHNASLIHDDVVDETETRRGQTTINRGWGNQIAVLVGDFFVSNALAVGIRTNNMAIITSLSDLGKELSLGEIDQITNARNRLFREDCYLGMIAKKTASLFMNCAKMGAVTAGASPEEYAPLVEFSRLLGLCFQIKDDIFDYFDSPEIGKPTGNDLREGKVTLPLIYALNTGDPEEAGKMRRLLMKDVLTAEDISILTGFAKENGGIEYAYARMKEMKDEADSLLNSYPDSIWKESLRDIFDFIISRDK